MATTETKEVTSLTQNMSEKINEIIPTDVKELDIIFTVSKILYFLNIKSASFSCIL